ncbi:hypothetical protein TrRE_jg3261, partial [Triparma retinervis]
MPTIVGRLCKSRQLSKKLAFLDLQIEDADSPSDSPSFTFVELVVKICPTLSSVKEAIRPLKLGDTICVVGDFEEEKEGKREHRTFKVVEPPTVVMRYAAEDGAPFQPVFVSAQKALVCQPVGNLPPPSPSSLCKYYTNTGRCPRGAACLYTHTDDKLLRSEFFKSRDLHRVSVMKLEEGYSSSLAPPSSSPSAPAGRASRTNRASAFADFLVSTFSLTESSLVLDVAGGRGDMSFELDALRNIPTITVDPRGRKLNKRQRKFLSGGGGEWGSHMRKMYHETEFFSAHPELRGRVTL